MNTKTFLAIILLGLLTACQAAIPVPIVTTTDTEFTLSEGQNATITDANLSITFITISNDGRCPSGIECAISGPVSISLSIRDKNGNVSEEALQTFTDNNGLSPQMEFEGIKDRTTIDSYQIKVTSVLPYPKNNFGSIKSSDYRVGLKVTKK